MCGDHASSYIELYSQLATYGIETRPVNVNDEDFLGELGREPHALFIAPDAFAELEIIRSVSRWLPVFALLNKIQPTLIGILFDEKIRLRTWQSIRDVLLSTAATPKNSLIAAHQSRNRRRDVSADKWDDA